VPDHDLRIDAWVEDEHRVHTLLRAVHDSNHGGIANARLRIEDALDVLGKYVQPVGPNDHFLLATFDEKPALGITLADITRV
jgi:hypothetical protein